jgi:bifunctional polynucleotide phosphatase/kinase
MLIIEGDDITNEPLVAFDLDYTLIKPKSGRKFPKDAADWQFIIDPAKLPKKFVIFSNAGIKGHTEEMKTKMEMIFLVTGRQWSYFAISERARKPATTMFDDARRRGLNIVKFVGDAAGRPGDFANSDYQFAVNSGVEFQTPEEYLGGTTLEYPRLAPINAVIEMERVGVIPDVRPERHLVLLVGAPASGKSTFAKRFTGYTIISMDHLKSRDKCIRECSRALLAPPHLVVVDNTSPDEKSRDPYITIYHLNPREEHCKFNNAKRENPVPKIAYSVYYKKLVPPVAGYLTAVVNVLGYVNI